MTARSAITEFLLGDRDRIHTFCCWAFGNEYDTCYHMDLLDKWNKLHGTQYKIRESEGVYPSCKKMIELWEMEVEADAIREKNRELSNHLIINT